MNLQSSIKHRPAPVWMVLPSLQILLLLFMAAPSGLLEWEVLGSFIAVTAIASWQLWKDPKPYSLHKIWWLFGALYLGFIPSIQAALHHTPWREGDIYAVTMLHANLLILACFAVYGSICRLLSAKPPVTEIASPLSPAVFVQRYRFIAPVVMGACGLALFFAYGWKGLLLRGHMEAAVLHYSTTFSLLLDKGVRGLMLYVSITGILLYRRQQISGWFLATLLIAAVAFNFPFAVPRYLAFTIYLSWLLAAGFPWLRKHVFEVGIIIMLLLAGPLVDVTRYAGKDMMQRLEHPAALFRKAYLTSDFDAYSSLCRTMQYVSIHGSTQGRQLKGVALFFVPRKVWPQKPVGSGAYLFGQLGFDFKNVACTYLAEGYINYGWMGSLLFTAVMAIVITRWDRSFWRNRNPLSYVHLFYFAACGMFLFILRGDLLSSFAYTAGLFASGWLLHQALLFRTRNHTHGRS